MKIQYMDSMKIVEHFYFLISIVYVITFYFTNYFELETSSYDHMGDINELIS